MNYNNLQQDDDDIVTLLSADGEEIDFVEIAGIAYNGRFYAILTARGAIERNGRRRGSRFPGVERCGRRG